MTTENRQRLLELVKENWTNQPADEERDPDIGEIKLEDVTKFQLSSGTKGTGMAFFEIEDAQKRHLVVLDGKEEAPWARPSWIEAIMLLSNYSNLDFVEQLIKMSEHADWFNFSSLETSCDYSTLSYVCHITASEETGIEKSDLNKRLVDFVKIFKEEMGEPGRLHHELEITKYEGGVTAHPPEDILQKKLIGGFTETVKQLPPYMRIKLTWTTKLNPALEKVEPLTPKELK